MGKSRATAPNMMARVSLLDDASHTVRLALGLEEDGKRNGNSAEPAVAMVPTGTSDELRKAASGVSLQTAAPRAPKRASATATHCHLPKAEPANQLLPRVTAFVIGLDGPSCINEPLM